MCREYTITNSCQHSREERRICGPIPTWETCSTTEKVEIIMDHSCQECSANIMSYLQRHVPSLEGDARMVVNALKLANPNRFSIGLPDGDEPFQSMVTKADLHCFQDLELVADRVMRRLALEDAEHAPLRLLVQLHRCIEQAQIDLAEDKILQHAYNARLRWPFTLVDVMNLAKDERTCNICMKEYLSAKDDDRQEEKPCKLPCGHVFGLSCLWKHIYETDVDHFHVRYLDLEELDPKVKICCPSCSESWDPAKSMDIVYEEVVSPWWMKYIRGEEIDVEVIEPKEVVNPWWMDADQLGYAI